MKGKLILFCLLLTGLVSSQADYTGISPETVRKGILYKKEHSFGLAVHSNGFYLDYNRGRIKTYFNTRLLHFDIGYLDHPKTTKTAIPFTQSSKPFSAYTFGRANSLMCFRIGRSQVTYFTEKAREKGVSIGMKWEGGINLGFLKPYYLIVTRNKDGGRTEHYLKYSPETAAEFLGARPDTDAASFLKGFGEVKLIPGFYGRLALRIDPGAFESWVRALNIGLQLDVYTKRPLILAVDKNPYAYLNFYVHFELGKRTQ